jgi:hypothetical protein
MLRCQRLDSDLLYAFDLQRSRSSAEGGNHAEKGCGGHAGGCPEMAGPGVAKLGQLR